MELLKLLESTEKLIKKAQEHGQQEAECSVVDYGVRKSWDCYGTGVKFVTTRLEAEQMYAFIAQNNVSHIGFDTEFNFTSPPIPVGGRGQYAQDPHSINPLLLSMTAACPDKGNTGKLATFVVDLRTDEVLPGLQKVFRLSVPFCAHYATVELFCLWQLGIEEPNNIWDTCIFEKSLTLGCYRPTQKKGACLSEEIRAEQQSKDLKAYGLSLLATCQRYGIEHAMSESKTELQQSFIEHEEGTAFTEAQIHYAAEDAVAACCLYPLQAQEAVQHNLLNHNITYEMPWVVTNARMSWNGVKVDRARAEQLQQKCSGYLEKVEADIREKYAITNPRSANQLKNYFESKNILDNFYDGKKYCFDKDMLQLHADKDQAIPHLEVARRLSDWLSNKIFDPRFDGADGRVHPDHRQLGADSGRQACRWPNMLGLDRVLRPLIIPEEGFAIIEADWNQEEVGVAAAIYQDQQLIAMYNSEDVYSSMAKVFFADKLSDEDKALSAAEFKHRHKDMRTQMKICTLGIIYGMSSMGLAENLGVPVLVADNLQQRFMEMFSSLRDSREECIELGGVRACADTVTGLKRYRTYRGRLSNRERNWLSNHPVQGSASTVLKATGNKLDRLCRGYGAKIITTVHDSILIEVPVAHRDEVAQMACRVMCDTLQEFFPQLRPKAEADLAETSCWNKDGETDAFERWVESNKEFFS